jgi:DNA-binding PadR family transcriptional regulator
MLQPLHGYALAQHIKRASGDLLQIEEGSLDPALQRLLKEYTIFECAADCRVSPSSDSAAVLV